MTEPVGDIAVSADDQADGTPADAPSRTFTQADVDRIVQDRLARAKQALPSDYDELKQAAAKLAEIEQANMSDLEREREARAKAEELAAAVQAEAREIRLTAALLAEAAKADRKIVDPEAAIALLDKSTLDLDDAGNPTNVAEAMDSLLKAKPYLVAVGGARGNADQGARGAGDPAQVSEAQLKTMTPEQIDQAHREGRLTALLGASR